MSVCLSFLCRVFHHKVSAATLDISITTTLNDIVVTMTIDTFSEYDNILASVYSLSCHADVIARDVF
jgi:hypothetical protein